MSTTGDKALDHAWGYFVLHANQRITVFNYFVIFAGVLCTGIAASIQSTPRLAAVGVALGGLLIILSFVFWRLDQRTAFLIKHAEDLIATLEPELAPLLASEVQKTTDAKKSQGLWTYGRAFRTIFWVMGLIGLAGAALSGLRAGGLLTWGSEIAVPAVPIAARSAAQQGALSPQGASRTLRTDHMPTRPCDTKKSNPAGLEAGRSGR